MREKDLANIIVQIGIDRGVDLDHIVDELGATTLPSFIDKSAYNAALIEAIEARLRQQVEERIQGLRRQLGLSASAPAGRLNEASPKPAWVPPVAEPATSDTLHSFPSDEETLDEDLQSDATMIWTTRHGKQP